MGEGPASRCRFGDCDCNRMKSSLITFSYQMGDEWLLLANDVKDTGKIKE
ncbi:hypothetical protein [Thermogutta sp.]